MSVESMTELSWVMYGISGAFAVAAVVLFFVLDIAKCWRMVSGRRAVRRAERRQTGRAVPGGGAVTIKLGCVPMEIGAEPEAFVGGAERAGRWMCWRSGNRGQRDWLSETWRRKNWI